MISGAAPAGHRIRDCVKARGLDLSVAHRTAAVLPHVQAMQGRIDLGQFFLFRIVLAQFIATRNQALSKGV